MLWKISGNRLQSPSYLLGTYHFSPYTVLDSIAGYADAFRSVRQVICEIDSIRPEELAEYELSVQLPADTTYADLLPPADLATLDSILMKYFSVSARQIGVKPGEICPALLLAKYNEQNPVPFDPDRAMDGFIIGCARRSGYEVVGLETAREQFRLMQDLTPLGEQAQDLMLMIRQPRIMDEALQEIGRAYSRQDLDALVTFYQAQLALSDSLGMPVSDLENDAMLKERNLKWMQHIPLLIDKRASLIVVGALHLPMEWGLIALLRREGYTVEPA